MKTVIWVTAMGMILAIAAGRLSAQIEVKEDDKTIQIITPELNAGVNKKGYVTGIAAGSFLDKKTGFHDPGHGLDIVDWIIEGPQICTRAGAIDAKVIKGADFVVIRQQYQYRTAAPGKKTGSTWEQNIVLQTGKRFFISGDRMNVVNSSDTMFFRLDMPGHIRHNKGDTFSEVYLSYREEHGGKIPSSEFVSDFVPDEKFNYRRDKNKVPQRFIRAYHLRDAKSGKDGPWLAGMTLEPELVYEAWCHQRGYVSFIEEIGGRPIKAGESFGAAFIVGYFDSIEEM